MPLYEIADDDALVPFMRVPGGPALYEDQIEEFVWSNAEEILGEPLLLIARQPKLPGGGRPDVVAFAPDARVVVIEIKRDIERDQLAQCLEYAGWAKDTNLDELAGMYHRGESAFFSDWTDFTEAPHPPVVDHHPRLILVAHGFHGRTERALEFLIENDLPVKLVRVSIYQDEHGRRILDVTGEHEPEFVVGEGTGTETPHGSTPRVLITDLMEAGLLLADDGLTWERPRLGETYHARVMATGALKLDDGREFGSPSLAAMRAADIVAADGWYCWRVDRLDGVLLNELRKEFLGQPEGGEEPTDSA